jgi:hypothetical protein
MHQHVNVAPTSINLEIAYELANRFRREAIIREMPVKRLLHDLLDVIASDKLIDAILDRPALPDRKIGRPKGSTTPKLKNAALKLKSAAVG